MLSWDGGTLRRVLPNGATQEFPSGPSGGSAAGDGPEPVLHSDAYVQWVAARGTVQRYGTRAQDLRAVAEARGRAPDGPSGSAFVKLLEALGAHCTCS